MRKSLPPRYPWRLESVSTRPLHDAYERQPRALAGTAWLNSYSGTGSGSVKPNAGVWSRSSIGGSRAGAMTGRSAGSSKCSSTDLTDAGSVTGNSSSSTKLHPAIPRTRSRGRVELSDYGLIRACLCAKQAPGAKTCLRTTRPSGFSSPRRSSVPHSRLFDALPIHGTVLSA